jgi:hypothetical protein
MPLRCRMPTAALLASGMGLFLVACSIPERSSTPNTAGLQPQQARIAALAARTQRVEDINAVKRLQRAYGYYLDEGLWDDAADLFATDATVEIGLDGVYRGRERIRAYFRLFGRGRNGLAAGELNEHLRVMPVITMGRDGTSAQGTWRAIILSGKLGAEAWWSEGPYENSYVKEGGIWKISRLHWFQTLRVPYEGGWAKHPDRNGAKFASDRLPPDSPPTVQYKTWPGAFTPPFHFRGRYPGLEPLSEAAASGAVSNGEWPLSIAALAARAARLADQDEIENLQRIYGYYLDKGLWSEAAALFDDNAEFEIQGRGVLHGREHILRYLRAIGPEGLRSGRLYDHMLLQPITHVEASGTTAKGRWRLFAQLARHGDFHEWATGVYENRYSKDQTGKWKIRRMHFFPTMVTPYEQGWGKASLPYSRYEPDLMPDAASRGSPSTYDHPFVAPFHYPHPVRSNPAALRSPPARRTIENGTLLSVAERQVVAAEDRASIENLQTAYGYYLATLLWDELADLFVEDGTIEIAMRGVYVGRAAVRRNLNLYGQAGLDDGVLHNHMQFQPVIHVAADGNTAQLRSRALSMMGNFERSAMWMGGIYENTFIKQEGRWKFRTDQQINSYFVPYETGWKDLAQRPPPGITASNPPDRPPTLNFDMYPKNFLAPYHYVNPATDR